MSLHSSQQFPALPPTPTPTAPSPIFEPQESSLKVTWKSRIIMFWHCRWHLINESLQGRKGKRRETKVKWGWSAQQPNNHQGRLHARSAAFYELHQCGETSTRAKINLCVFGELFPFAIIHCYRPRVIFHNLTSPGRFYVSNLWTSLFLISIVKCVAAVKQNKKNKQTKKPNKQKKVYFAPFVTESMSGSEDLRPPVIELDHRFFTPLLKLRGNRSFFSPPCNKLKVG